MKWAERWADYIDDLAWLRRAMAQTYSRLCDEDKEKIRYEYELFLEHDKFCDWEAMAFPCFDALCFILDRLGRRVESEGILATVVKELAGETKEDAMGRLDTCCYEFIDWMQCGKGLVAFFASFPSVPVYRKGPGWD